MLYTFKLAVLVDKPEEAVNLVSELNKITGGDSKLVRVLYESKDPYSLAEMSRAIGTALFIHSLEESETIIQLKPVILQ